MKQNKIKLNKKFYKESCDYPPIQQFRIYDPNEKKFHYSGGTPMMMASFFDLTAPLYTYYGMPYQRMIFLEDKNNKPIYENDILKCLDTHGKDTGMKRVVVFQRGSCLGLFIDANRNQYKNFLKGKDLTDNWVDSVPWIDSYPLKDSEIIGNIDENPELLK